LQAVQNLFIWRQFTNIPVAKLVNEFNLRCIWDGVSWRSCDFSEIQKIIIDTLL